MMMLLTLLLASVFVVAVLAMLFAQVDPATPTRPEIRPERTVDLPRFFAADVTRTPARDVPIPIEVLLRQIDRHVRLEQAAAQTFLEMPSAASLHSPSASPFVN